MYVHFIFVLTGEELQHYLFAAEDIYTGKYAVYHIASLDKLQCPNMHSGNIEQVDRGVAIRAYHERIAIA